MKLSKNRKQQLTSEFLKKQKSQPEPGHVFPTPKIAEGNFDFSELKGNLVCYFDGACEPRNPGGNMGIGACIRCGNGELFAYSDFVPAARHNSNNVAEYMAFEKLLDFFIEKKCSNQRIFIYGDSKLVIEQMFGS